MTPWSKVSSRPLTTLTATIAAFPFQFFAKLKQYLWISHKVGFAGFSMWSTKGALILVKILHLDIWREIHLLLFAVQNGCYNFLLDDLPKIFSLLHPVITCHLHWSKKRWCQKKKKYWKILILILSQHTSTSGVQSLAKTSSNCFGYSFNLKATIITLHLCTENVIEVI